MYIMERLPVTTYRAGIDEICSIHIAAYFIVPLLLFFLSCCYNELSNKQNRHFLHVREVAPISDNDLKVKFFAYI